MRDQDWKPLTDRQRYVIAEREARLFKQERDALRAQLAKALDVIREFEEAAAERELDGVYQHPARVRGRKLLSKVTP